MRDSSPLFISLLLPNDDIANDLPRPIWRHLADCLKAASWQTSRRWRCAMATGGNQSWTAESGLQNAVIISSVRKLVKSAYLRDYEIRRRLEDEHEKHVCCGVIYPYNYNADEALIAFTNAQDMDVFMQQQKHIRQENTVTKNRNIHEVIWKIQATKPSQHQATTKKLMRLEMNCLKICKVKQKVARAMKTNYYFRTFKTQDTQTLEFYKLQKLTLNLLWKYFKMN
ncbi:uncharacterized protein LOC133346042 isoform X5 [Lethenteron reissneri]|uniref:uncharacterized protein LOC133346042 isoform X5 n=1 Tax=Lethenteron reissneri TaxID=7753 RepID=UPI002AB785D8|nr:uncharacterized protein LOC133346042 isoform X5 [Lethenteron reissneri]